MVYAVKITKFKGVHIVVKNNILLTVLLASFAAPAFSSFLSSVPYVSNEATKLAVTFGGLELLTTTTQLFHLQPALTFHSNEVASTAKETPTPAETSVASETLKDAGVSLLNSKVAASVSLSTVTLDVKTLGVNGGVTVNVVPTVIKTAAAYALLFAGNKLLSTVRP